MMFVTYLKTRDGEVRNFESHGNGRLWFGRGIAFHRGQTETGPHNVLLTAGETLYTPDDSIILRDILAGANGRLKSRWVHIAGHRNQNLHLIGCASAFKLSFGLQRKRKNSGKNHTFGTTMSLKMAQIIILCICKCQIYARSFYSHIWWYIALMKTIFRSLLEVELSVQRQWGQHSRFKSFHRAFQAEEIEPRSSLRQVSNLSVIRK